jgi:hypothetical protein
MNAIFVLVALAVLAGQASSGRERAARQSVAALQDHRLTAEEIRRSRAHTAYEAIVLLRPGWLAPRERGDAASLGPAAVYLDSREIGSTEALASVPARAIRSIRFLDAATDAPSDHVRPSILITTR